MAARELYGFFASVPLPGFRPKSRRNRIRSGFSADVRQPIGPPLEEKACKLLALLSRPAAERGIIAFVCDGWVVGDRRGVNFRFWAIARFASIVALMSVNALR